MRLVVIEEGVMTSPKATQRGSVAVNKKPARYVFRSEDGVHTFELEQPREFARLIGEELFAAFLKCFRGVDQIHSAETLMLLDTKFFRGRSVASDRVGVSLGFLMTTIVYEMATALQELCNAKVYAKVTDKQKWADVDSFRKKWHREKEASNYRNEFGAHLGDLDSYKAGLTKKLNEAGETMVYLGVHHTFIGLTTIVMAGVGSVVEHRSRRRDEKGELL